MEDAQSKNCVSIKGVAKFFLLYFTSLLILLIIFTAFYNEPMDETQKRWWWAFLATLLLNTALCLSSLVVLIYTDYYKSGMDNSGNHPEVDLEQNEASLKSPITPQNSQSASYKTILTINSTPNPPATSGQPADGGRSFKAGFEGFMNMTPATQGQSKSGPITVVDLTKRQKTVISKQKTVNPTQPPLVSSINKLETAASTVNKEGDKKKKKKKHGKDKNKNAKRKR